MSEKKNLIILGFNRKCVMQILYVPVQGKKNSIAGLRHRWAGGMLIHFKANIKNGNGEI